MSVDRESVRSSMSSGFEDDDDLKEALAAEGIGSKDNPNAADAETRGGGDDDEEEAPPPPPKQVRKSMHGHPDCTNHVTPASRTCYCVARQSSWWSEESDTSEEDEVVDPAEARRQRDIMRQRRARSKRHRHGTFFGVPKINGTGLATIVQNCANLRELNVSQCMFITDVCIQQIVAAAHVALQRQLALGMRSDAHGCACACCVNPRR